MPWSSMRIVIVLLLLAEISFGQVNRYMVFFKDKNGSPYSISNPSQFLSQKAIDRRAKQGNAVSTLDIPVVSGYIQGVKDTGVDVFFKTRWMNGVLMQGDASLIPAIQALSFVQSVELVAPQAKLLPGGRKKTNLRLGGGLSGASTEMQLQMIGVDEMHQAGYKGEGITIAVFDAGFPGVNLTSPFQHLFTEGRLNDSASFDFVYNSTDVFQHDEHGTWVFSVISAYEEGTFTGGAYESNFQLYVTEDAQTEYRIEEYNWLFAAERADSAGVDIISSSLGYYDFDDASMNYSKADMDGNTTVISRAAQLVAERGIVVVCSAGNEGNRPWEIITAPSDAKDVLAIANVDAGGNRSLSSSIGPSADGRVKPDVAALGSGTSIIRSNGTVSSASGTSLSAPLIASLVAGIWQRYPELSNKEIIQLLKESGSQANNPDNFLGYGIPNFSDAVKYLEENPVTVFPNPISTAIQIKFTNPKQTSPLVVEMINAQGQMVNVHSLEFNEAARTYTADCTNLSAGIYILKIAFSDRRFTFKLIKV